MKKRRPKISARVKEEAAPGYGEKGKTPNVQRSTFNVQLEEKGAGVTQEKRYDLEERLLECGTSPLANQGELQGAESRKDFIHKLGICLKEIKETRRWLRLVHRVPLLAPPKVAPLLSETEELIRIFATSIRTAKQNQP